MRARKGSNKESAAIAICTKSVLQKRGRTMKRYTKGRLTTQRKFRGGAQPTIVAELMDIVQKSGPGVPVVLTEKIDISQVPGWQDQVAKSIAYFEAKRGEQKSIFGRVASKISNVAMQKASKDDALWFLMNLQKNNGVYKDPDGEDTVEKSYLNGIISKLDEARKSVGF